MFCKRCGECIPDGSAFCPACGAALSAESSGSTQRMAAPVLRVDYARGSAARQTPSSQVEPSKRASGGMGRNIAVFLATFLVAGGVALGALVGTGILDISGLLGKNDAPAAEPAPTETPAEEEGAAEQQPADASAAQEDAAQAAQPEQPEQPSQAPTSEPASPQAPAQTTPPEQQSAPAETVQGSESGQAITGYILPDSATRRYSRSELEKLSNWELMIARNEIYARRGRKFNDAELRSYFENCSWYSGTIEPNDFNESMLSPIEKDNAYLMLDIESSRG